MDDQQPGDMERIKCLGAMSTPTATNQLLREVILALRAFTAEKHRMEELILNELKDIRKNTGPKKRGRPPKIRETHGPHNA